MFVSGVRALLKLRAPDGVSLQCGPKGFHRTEQMLQYLAWVLPVAEPPEDGFLVYLDWFAAHTEPRVISFVESRIHSLVFHGGGTTDKAQVNDTHIHKPDGAVFRGFETEESDEQLRKIPGKLPVRGHQKVMDDAAIAWCAVNHKSGNESILLIA